MLPNICGGTREYEGAVLWRLFWGAAYDIIPVSYTHLDVYKRQGVECVVARCNVGKVNAAICAQTMILRYAPSRIINLSLIHIFGRFATASADNYGNTPDKAVDGQVGKNNRWAYEGGGVGDWLQVDLRQVCKINSVKIFWEGFGSIDVGYKVQLSNDGKQWTDAATVPISEHEATKTITFEEQQEARYVRIPVSYTHLDVYKRQIHIFTALIICVGR